MDWYLVIQIIIGLIALAGVVCIIASFFTGRKNGKRKDRKEV